MMTKYEIIKSTAKALEANGVESSDFEAKELVNSVLGNALLDFKVTPEQEDAIQAALNKRLERIPLQYILGEWEFYGLPVKVGPGVLIPRPDTEALVEQALKIINSTEKKKVFDLCAGSGCIGIALAHYGKAEVTFFEKSEKALGYLKDNLSLNNIKAEVLQCDVLTMPPYGKTADMIVSNPPYIRSKVIEALEPEVKNEPKMALDGGDDGLIFYRHIAKNWKSALTNGGAMLFEIGFDQAEEVTDIMQNEGFFGVRVVKDLAGNDRVVIGYKQI